MNIEDPTPTPPARETEYTTGDGEARRDSSPSRRRGPRREGGRPGAPEGRRDRPERGARGERSERGGRPGRGGRSRGDRDKEAPRQDQPTPVSSSVDDSALDDLGGDLLASVSRSFSLTIHLLPEPLREPITLGYLLARAQDTVADTATLPAGTRLEHLRALLDMVKYGPDPEILRPLGRDLISKQTHDGERDLLEQLARCLAWLEAQPADDRWELRRTLARIGRAQELDLLRFGDATADAPKALATQAEFEEYTDLIAGCVGELWTRLCQRHLEAGWSKLDESAMLALGKRFGQGLQTVNILRDLPEDLANGRCYIPAELLAQHGLEPADLRKEPTRARPLLDALRKQAVEHLDAAWDYVKALTPRQLRYACALPVLIGLETLGLLAKTSPLEAPERLKISRGSVAGLMASAKFGALFNPWLSRLHSRLRKRAA